MNAFHLFHPFETSSCHIELQPFVSIPTLLYHTLHPLLRYSMEIFKMEIDALQPNHFAINCDLSGQHTNPNVNFLGPESNELSSHDSYYHLKPQISDSYSTESSKSTCNELVVHEEDIRDLRKQNKNSVILNESDAEKTVIEDVYSSLFVDYIDGFRLEKESISEQVNDSFEIFDSLNNATDTLADQHRARRSRNGALGIWNYKNCFKQVHVGLDDVDKTLARSFLLKQIQFLVTLRKRCKSSE